MSDSGTPETVERRLGQIEHLLSEVLERHARSSVKDRLSIERAIERVGLNLADHRKISEATGKFFTTEKVLERHLEETLFLRGQQGWEMVALSSVSDDLPGLEREVTFLVVFRREDGVDSVSVE